MLLEYPRLCGGKKKKHLKQPWLKLRGLKYIFLFLFTKLPQFTHHRRGFLLWFWSNIAKFPHERELVCGGKGVEEVSVRGSAVWHLLLKTRRLVERCHCGGSEPRHPSGKVPASDTFRRTAHYSPHSSCHKRLFPGPAFYISFTQLKPLLSLSISRLMNNLCSKKTFRRTAACTLAT